MRGRGIRNPYLDARSRRNKNAGVRPNNAPPGPSGAGWTGRLKVQEARLDEAWLHLPEQCGGIAASARRNSSDALILLVNR
jgi:hypothetical protein